MARKTATIRSPVRRAGAERYLLYTLLSFAASVGLTRLFLELTGYPQLGGGPLHVAHVLWGGLLLFAASLLPLMLANRWACTVSALLAGAGVGLFIDEVGKFITTANDYFYPPAAPIIYAFFLLTLLVYLQFRRPPARNPRAEFYRVLDGMGEVLDHDLEEDERDELLARLRRVARSPDSNLARLAEDLIRFLEHESLLLLPPKPDLLERAGMKMAAAEARWLPRGRWRVALAGGFAALGAYLLAELIRILTAVFSLPTLQATLTDWIARGHVQSSSALAWFITHIAIEASVGSLLIAAGVLLLLRAERAALWLGTYGLLLALCIMNILVFYFNQFSSIPPTLVEFALLLAALRYRRKFLTHFPSQPKAGPPVFDSSGEGLVT